MVKVVVHDALNSSALVSEYCTCGYSLLVTMILTPSPQFFLFPLLPLSSFFPSSLLSSQSPEGVCQMADYCKSSQETITSMKTKVYIIHYA